jgi:HEAT repeat protein
MGARQLFLLGDEAVSPLIKFLSDSDQGKRVAAAKGLAYIGNPQGMQALRNAINVEKDEEAKSGISDCLSNFFHVIWFRGFA